MERIQQWFQLRRPPPEPRTPPPLPLDVQLEQLKNDIAEFVHISDIAESLVASCDHLLDFWHELRQDPVDQRPMHMPQLLGMIDSLRQSVDAAKNWPREPVVDLVDAYEKALTAPCSSITLPEGRKVPPRPQNYEAILSQLPTSITVIHEQIPLTCKLTNPMPLPYSPKDGYLCDECNAAGIFVAYQSVTTDGMRDSGAFQPNCIGYDVCLGCAVAWINLCHRTVLEFLDCLSAAQAKAVFRDPTLRGPLHNLPQPESYYLMPAREATHTSCAMKLHSCTVEVQANHDVGVQEEIFLRAVVSFSPMDGTVMGWHESVLSKNANHSLFEPQSWVNRSSEIPQNWKDNCSIFRGDFCEDSGRVHGDLDDDVCGVCLEPVSLSHSKCVRTRCCKKWFHAYCAIRAMRQKNDLAVTQRCPMCRDADPLSHITNPEFMDQNKCTVRCRLNRSLLRESSWVYIAVLLTNDGEFHDLTDIGTCLKILVPPLHQALTTTFTSGPDSYSLSPLPPSVGSY